MLDFLHLSMQISVTKPGMHFPKMMYLQPISSRSSEGEEEKKFKTIEQKLKLLSDENGSLKEGKSRAEKRADTYKQRFLKYDLVQLQILSAILPSSATTRCHFQRYFQQIQSTHTRVSADVTS